MFCQTQLLHSEGYKRDPQMSAKPPSSLTHTCTHTYTNTVFAACRFYYCPSCTFTAFFGFYTPRWPLTPWQCWGARGVVCELITWSHLNSHVSVSSKPWKSALRLWLESFPSRFPLTHGRLPSQWPGYRPRRSPNTARNRIMAEKQTGVSK